MEFEQKMKDLLSGKNESMNKVSKMLGGGSEKTTDWESKVKRMLQ